jgi:hypothetical protein
MIHTMPELATDSDVVLQQRTFAAYPVIVQFDLYGVLLRSQIAQVLGHIDILASGADPYKAAQTVSTSLGTPLVSRLAGVLDSRWSFKHEELDELHDLVRPFWSGFRW